MKERVIAKARQLGPMETMFKLELNSLEEKDKIAKIMSCFQLWTKGCENFDNYLFDQTDDAFLWIMDLLKETFLARQMPEQDNLWDFNIHLRKAYKFLPDKFESGFYPFPKTKKVMLQIILEQWDVKKCDEHGWEIFMFIWSIYIDERSPEERKNIDAIMLERLDMASSEDVEKWIKWIGNVRAGREDVNVKLPYLHARLGKLFAIARARAHGFNGAWWDVRREKIVDALGVREVDDDVLDALCQVCLEQIMLLKDVKSCMEQIVSYLLLKSKTKIIYKLERADTVKIDIDITEMPKYGDIISPEEYLKSILKFIADEFERLGVLGRDGRIKFKGGKVVNLKLSVFDAEGNWISMKEWFAE